MVSANFAFPERDFGPDFPENGLGFGDIRKGHLMSDEAWKAFCLFSRNPHRDRDPREPWDVVTTPRPKIKTRKRRMTLARAMKQANRAGVAVQSVTVKSDGVELQLGEAATPDHEVNEWDVVKQ